MRIPLFQILNAAPAVTTLMKTDGVLKIFPFGEAPDNVKPPYGVYTIYNANPENYLAGRTDIDNKGTQVTLHAANASNLEACFEAIRTAVEPHAHLINYTAPDRDIDTKLYSCIMEFDFWGSR